MRPLVLSLCRDNCLLQLSLFSSRVTEELSSCLQVQASGIPRRCTCSSRGELGGETYWGPEMVSFLRDKGISITTCGSRPSCFFPF